MHLGLGSHLDSCDKEDGVEDSLGVLQQFCYSGFYMAIRLVLNCRLSFFCPLFVVRGICVGRVESGKFDRPSFVLQAPLSRGVSVGHEIHYSACLLAGAGHQPYIIWPSCLLHFCISCSTPSLSLLSS